MFISLQRFAYTGKSLQIVTIDDNQNYIQYMRALHNNALSI